MSRITEIRFDLTLKLQQYEMLKIGATAEVNDGERADKVMDELKKFVTKEGDTAIKQYWDKLKNPAGVKVESPKVEIKEPVAVPVPKTETAPVTYKEKVATNLPSTEEPNF